MMYYILSERKHCGDIFVEALDSTNERDAKVEAYGLFDHMSDGDKKSCTRFDLCSFDSEVDGEFEERLDDHLVLDILSNPRTWYAQMVSREDTDHGYGTYDKCEALCWLSEQRDAGNDEAHIAIIDTLDDFCEDEIWEE